MLLPKPFYYDTSRDIKLSCAIIRGKSSFHPLAQKKPQEIRAIIRRKQT